MNCYDSKNNDLKNELGQAIIRFLWSITSLLPMIFVALGAAIFINQLFTPPFGFMCKSISSEVSKPKRRIEPLQIIPMEKPNKEKAIIPQDAPTHLEDNEDK